MDCRDINEKLSAYIEDRLAPEEKGTVDRHLSTCRSCRTALHDLRKTIEYAQGVEEMEPPAWLAQKVMAQVREESEGKGILRKLFYPLHIKIPAEIFATIAIAAVTVFVFKAIQPVMKQTEMPLKEVTAPEKKKRERAAAMDERQDSRGIVSQYPERRMEEGERGKTAVPAAKAKMNENVLQESFSSDVSEQKELRALAPEAQSMSKRIRQARTFIVYVKDIESARHEIENSVKTLDGRVISTEPAPDRYTYAVKIDSRKMDDLKNELNRIGEYTIKPTDDETPDTGTVRIELMEHRNE